MGHGLLPKQCQQKQQSQSNRKGGGRCISKGATKNKQGNNEPVKEFFLYYLPCLPYPFLCSYTLQKPHGPNVGVLNRISLLGIRELFLHNPSIEPNFLGPSSIHFLPILRTLCSQFFCSNMTQLVEDTHFDNFWITPKKLSLLDFFNSYQMKHLLCSFRSCSNLIKDLSLPLPAPTPTTCNPTTCKQLSNTHNQQIFFNNSANKH